MATALPEPGDPQTLYVVDLTGYVFRAYHALPPMSTSTGEPTHAVYGVTQMLLNLITTQKPHRLALALDAPGPSFRKSIYEAYKATRPAPPPDLREQIERLQEVVEAYAIPCLSVPGFEADDLIATLVDKARGAGLKLVIVSADKDLLQLVDGDVVMFDTMRDRVYGREETFERLGVMPEQVCDYLALTGDSSDNIPGVPSVGPKTAAALLGEYATLDDVYAHVEGMKKKALRQRLIDHKDDAYLSRQLVCLRRDAPIEFDLDELTYRGADEAKLRTLFTKLEFHRLLAKLAPPPPVVRSCRSITTEAELEEVVGAIREAGRLALYTVSEGHDPVAAPIVGLALAWTDDAAAYVPTGHHYLGAPPQLPLPQVLDALRPLMDELPVAVGDLKRELLLLGRHGVTLPKVRFDAMLASYLVDPERHGHSLEEIARSELGQSLASHDALIEKKRGKRPTPLFEVEIERTGAWGGARAHVVALAERLLEPRIEAQGLERLLHDVELPLARVLARMEREGIRVDTQHLKELSSKTAQRIEALEAEARAIAPDLKINSPRSLEKVLFDELGLPVVKRTKTSRSTDHDVLEELASQHPLPRLILEHRMLSKLKSTYLDALPRQVHPETGRIHTRFNQAVTATGRMSSSEPNLQNIPIRTDEGRAIRDAFIPREGWQLMSADYSQIELRVLAHLSGDADLVDAFNRGEDVHVRTAKVLFDVDDDGVTRAMRGQAKTVNYAVIYGQTQFALARNLGISKTDAKRYIDTFFEKYSGVARFMEDTVERARHTGGVRTLMGRWRRLPDIRSKNRGLRAAAERAARNTPIQGTAADLMKIAMVRIDRALSEERFSSRMILTVHDELVFEVAPGEEEPLRTLVKDLMEHVVELSVPLRVDVGVGPTWNAAH